MRNVDEIIFDWLKTGDNKELLKYFIASSKNDVMRLLEDPRDFFATVVSMQDSILLCMISKFIKDHPEVMRAWCFNDMLYICQIFGHAAFTAPMLMGSNTDQYKNCLLTQCIIAELMAVFLKVCYDDLGCNPIEKDRVFSQLLSRLQNSKFAIVKNVFLYEGLKLFASNKEDQQYFLDSIPKKRTDGSKYFPVNYHTQFYVDCVKRDPNIDIVSRFVKNFDQQVLAKAGCQNLRDLFANVLVREDSKYLLEFLSGVEGMFYAAATFQKISSLTSISTQQKVSSAGKMILEVAPELVEMVMSLAQVHQSYCAEKGESALSK